MDLDEVATKAKSGANSGGMTIEPTDDEKQILDELVRQYINYNMFYALIDYACSGVKCANAGDGYSD